MYSRRLSGLLCNYRVSPSLNLITMERASGGNAQYLNKSELFLMGGFFPGGLKSGVVTLLGGQFYILFKLY